jgi:tetrahydromethanopterin S-methyltransferase subunit B
MFEQNKWNSWWNSLSPSTQEYLKAQPIWHDVDMFKVAAFGAFFGFLIGLLF